ncbi:MAG: sulfatase [Opitutaceae bacterium]
MKLPAFLALLALAFPVVAQPRPNILLLVSEDNGPELGCYGDPSARTPRLDRLASEGIRFNRAFVAQAGCSQSRASFLTGLYPHQHGQIGLATWGYRLYREDTPNLPRQLKGAGYRTGIIGKLHVNPEAAFPFDFREQPTANFQRRNLRDYARHAESFFRGGDQPFFLSINFPDAHDPWLRQVDGLPAVPQTGRDVRPLPYFGIDPPGMREMVADYYNSLARLDTLIGDVLDALERTGKARETVVIYLGDHGADFLRGKRTCYEGGVRIPLLVRWPGRIAPQVREELVSTVDLLPTLLAAAGAPAVPGLAGRPLQPLFAPGPVAWRGHLFTEWHTHAAAANYHPQRAVRDDRYKLIENLLPGVVNPDYADTIRKLEADAVERGETGFAGGIQRAVDAAPSDVRAGYALMRQPPRYELYDLRTDPHEFRNLADSPAHGAVLRELVAALDAWRRASGDPLLEPENLRRLTAEVTAVRSKAAGRELHWGYPDYFFGREPAAAAAPAEGAPRKKRKAEPPP